MKKRKKSKYFRICYRESEFTEATKGEDVRKTYSVSSRLYDSPVIMRCWHDVNRVLEQHGYKTKSWMLKLSLVYSGGPHNGGFK